MPIYAYRCGECGHAKDVLQKMSDPVLTTCPSCGAEAFTKQLTAAGFQLKGSGWYATDFKGGGAAATSVPPVSSTGEAKSDSKSESKSDGKSDSKSADSSSSPTAAGSSGPCGGSCACH
jgi:putative FmdB family regulatory protein